MKIFHTVLLVAALLAAPAIAQDQHHNPQPFSQWMKEFKQEALSKGIFPQELLDDAFATMEPIEKVIKLDRKQPEGHLTLEQYLTNTVTDKRIEEGRALYEEHRELLEAIGKQYGVQPKFIVALWGIETNFGKIPGGFDTLDSLATLAYDGRRSDYFRDELFKALQILVQEKMQPGELRGSWAGALGQCQFMPTSFLMYAVDYDKDGKHDIWNSLPDVFASIANYLSSSGWKGDEGWGRHVMPHNNFNDIKLEKSISEWNAEGVRNADGTPLNDNASAASLILVGEGDDAEPYLIYGNYKVLLKWNRSRYFATAVSTLADSIAQ